MVEYNIFLIFNNLYLIQLKQVSLQLVFKLLKNLIKNTVAHIDDDDKKE